MHHIVKTYSKTTDFAHINKKLLFWAELRIMVYICDKQFENWTENNFDKKLEEYIKNKDSRADISLLHNIPNLMEVNITKNNIQIVERKKC